DRSLDRLDHAPGGLAFAKFFFTEARANRLLDEVLDELSRHHQVAVVGVLLGVLAFRGLVTAKTSRDFVAFTEHEFTKAQRVAHATLGLEQQVSLIAVELAAAAHEVALVLQGLAEDL